jgi:hypothetical protein
MLSLEEIAQIKAEIERRERLRQECTDTGIRNRIGTWIEAEKKKLTSDPSKEGTGYSLKKKSSPHALQVEVVKLQPTKPTPEPLNGTRSHCRQHTSAAPEAGWNSRALTSTNLSA